MRAFVHQLDERSAALQNEGAEILVGDLLEHDDILRAMDGVIGQITGQAPQTVADFVRANRQMFER